VSGNNYFQNTTGPVAAPATNNPYAAAQIFNLTDCNTGTNYGAYDVTDNAKINLTNFFQNYTPIRTNSITASGLPSYQISPVFYSASARGYPTQFVTGIVPVYWCSPNLGNSGDTVAIGSDTYYFFNAGSGFGMLMKTS
jgi:hypothetical protein